MTGTAGPTPEPTAPAPLRVVLVDDQPVYRIVLRQLLGQHDGITVVGEAADGGAAIELVERLEPDLVVLDVRMPGVDGPTAAAVVAQRWPRVAVLLCSSRARCDLPRELPAPYVPKELVSAEVVLAAARAHAAGG